jgi:hypothetical protein
MAQVIKTNKAFFIKCVFIGHQLSKNALYVYLVGEKYNQTSLSETLINKISVYFMCYRLLLPLLGTMVNFSVGIRINLKGLLFAPFLGKITFSYPYRVKISRLKMYRNLAVDML